MSFLGARTKKVTTYGRKNKTRIINIHADLSYDHDHDPGAGPSSPRTPTKPQPPSRSHERSGSGAHPVKMKMNSMNGSDTENCDISIISIRDTPPPKATAARRPPLQTKTSQMERVPPTPNAKLSPPLKKTATATFKARLQSGRKSEFDSCISVSSDEEPVLRKHVVRKRRVVIPRSPTTLRTGTASPRRDSPAVLTARGAHPLRQAHAPTSMRGHAGMSRNDLAERLVAVVIPKAADVVDLTQGDDDRVKAQAPQSRKSVLPTPPPEVEAASPAPLSDLLNICSLSSPVPFSAIFTKGDFLACLPGRLKSGSKPLIRKIGEASYSEVFSIRASPEDTEVVVKIIPLLDGDAREEPASDDEAEEFPDCSDITEVMREIISTRHMGRVPGGGFIDFLGAFVVEGTYPRFMLNEWDAYNEANESQSVRPDNFTPSQKYAFLVLSDGGDDLESYRFEHSKGWVQAAAVFWQVADALARAEQWTQFEHRDLHEGQILVTPVETRGDIPMRVNYLDPEETAVRTSLIDFGLSRLRKDGRATATPLPAECYDGVGEQWDVYRAMRALIAGEGERAVPTAAWDSFYPRTNVLWLHYLARRLLHFTKTLRKPVVRRGRGSATTKKAQKKDPVRERCDAAYAMLIMVESEILAEPVRRGRKSQGFASAEDVMAWGRVQGWVA